MDETSRKREADATNESNNYSKKQKKEAKNIEESNTLLFLVQNGTLKRMISKTEEAIEFNKTLCGVNRYFKEIHQYCLLDETVSNIDDIGELLGHVVIYPHQNVKCIYNNNINSFRRLEDDFPDIKSLDITIDANFATRMITFRSNVFNKLKSLIIRDRINMVDFGTIPTGTEKLVLIDQNARNPPLGKAFGTRLPVSVNTLIIDSTFNDSLANIPSSVKNLYIRDLLDHQSYNVSDLKDTIERLYIGEHWFTPDITSVPANLTHLHLGDQFDGNIDALEQTKITHLFLNYNFEQSVDKLPQTLQYLRVSGNFDQPIDNLPKSLQHLSIEGQFNQKINLLPESLSYLLISSVFFREEEVRRWPNLRHLRMITPNCSASLVNLPSSLETLYVAKSPHFDGDYHFWNLPNLKKVRIDGDFNAAIDNSFPESVTHLILGNGFNQPLIYLPKALRYLRVGLAYQHLFIGHRSDSMLEIVLHPLSAMGKKLMSGEVPFQRSQSNVSYTVCKKLPPFDWDDKLTAFSIFGAFR